MRSFKSGVLPPALGFLCLLVSGCGESDVVPVSGTLTYKGKPVTNAYIHFVPEKGRPSSGRTDDQGRFTLTFDPENNGALRGKHRVFVEYNSSADQNRPGAIPGETVRLPPDLKTFFDKYGGTSSKVEVLIDKPVSDLRLDWD